MELLDQLNLGVTATAMAAIVTASLGYLAGRRWFSGRVSTTPADALWDEAKGLRREYRETIAELRAQVLELREELRRRTGAYDELIDGLKADIVRLRTELVEKDGRIAHLESQNRSKDTRIDFLETENSNLHAAVSELQRARAGNGGAGD